MKRRKTSKQAAQQGSPHSHDPLSADNSNSDDSTTTALKDVRVFVKDFHKHLDNKEEERKRALLFKIQRSIRSIKYEKYTEILLTSWSERNDKKEEEYEKIVDEIFTAGVNSIKEIFSPSNFNMNDEKAKADFQWCLLKLFLIASKSSEERLPKEKDLDEFLDWLREQQIEEILQRKSQTSMIHIFASENDLRGVEWILDNYEEKELLNILNNEHDIFECLIENNHLETELTRFICFKLEQLLEKEPQTLVKRKEKIRNKLLERGLEEEWSSLEENWSSVAAEKWIPKSN